MQAEMLTRICPLCRRAVSEAGSPGTRLCGDCRAMLDPILPRAGFVQPDYAVALGAATLASTTAQPPLAHAVDFDETAFAPAAGSDEEFERLSEAEEVAAPFDARAMATAPAEATQTPLAQPFAPTLPDAFITPDQYDEPEDFIAADRYEEASETATAAPLTPPVAPVYAEPAGAVAERAASEGALSETWGLNDALPVLGSDLAQPAAQAATSTDYAFAEEPAPAAPPADPWDDPLPAWEYSHREWPLLVKDEKGSLASRLKWPLVAAVVVLGLAAASYFFFFKSRGEAPVTQQALTVPVEPPPAPPAASPISQASATPAATEEIKAATPAPASAAAEGQWKHALQAMASPVESEANAAAERLKTAAIPAYVVRAEVSGHVWYRVRVGRFASVEDAQRYAVEARNRARAAGIALKELQVTAYDKP